MPPTLTSARFSMSSQHRAASLVVVLGWLLLACGPCYAGTPDHLEYVSGAFQSVPPGTPFPEPLAVKVLDSENNPVQGVVVRFSPNSDPYTALLSATSVVTGANGIASVTAVANGVPGSYPITVSIDSPARSGGLLLQNRGPGFRVGDQLADVSGRDQNGATRRLRDFLEGGNSYLLITVDAMWCPPSNESAEWPSQARIALGKAGILLHGVPLILENQSGRFGNQTDAAAWADRYDLLDPVLHVDGAYNSALGQAAYAILLGNPGSANYPTSILVAPDGAILDWEIASNHLTPERVIERVLDHHGWVEVPDPVEDLSFTTAPVSVQVDATVGATRFLNTVTPGTPIIVGSQSLTVSGGPTDAWFVYHAGQSIPEGSKLVTAQATFQYPDGFQRGGRTFVGDANVILTIEGSESAIYVEFAPTAEWVGNQVTLSFDVDDVRQAFLAQYPEYAEYVSFFTGFEIFVGTRLDTSTFTSSVQLSIPDVSVNEGAGNASLTIHRGTPFGLDAWVPYTTSIGTAGTADFMQTSGMAVARYGTLGTTIKIPILQDTIDEANESFSVTLGQPIGGTLVDANAQVTIVDDDAPPVLSIADARFAELNTSSRIVSVPVTISRPRSTTTVVPYKSVDTGSAKADVDYGSAGGTLSIPAGATTGSILVHIYGDTAIEFAETFHLVLGAPTGVVLGDGLGQVTIVDDDRDTTAPVIYPKSNVIVEIAMPSTASTPVYYTAPAAKDNMDGAVTVTCSPPSGKGFFYGTTTVSCTASDRAGNLTTSSFNVVVRPPTIPGAVFDPASGVRLTTVSPRQRVLVHVNPGAFQPGALVGLTFVQSDGQLLKLRSGRASNDGSLELDTMVPAQAKPGQVQIRADSEAATSQEYDRAWYLTLSPP